MPLLSGFFDDTFLQCPQALVVDLYDLPADTGDVSFGLSHRAADAFQHNFIVLIDELCCTVARAERSNLPAILD